GAETVVEILIEFVPEDAAGKDARPGYARQQRTTAAGGNRGVAPEAHRRGRGRNDDARELPLAALRGENRSGQRVLGTTAVSGRAEPRIAPRAGPHRRIERIDDGAGVRLLVRHQRPVRRVRAVDAPFPARLPEDFVAAEERQVDAGGARVLDVRPLRGRPVLVVSD